MQAFLKVFCRPARWLTAASIAAALLTMTGCDLLDFFEDEGDAGPQEDPVKFKASGEYNVTIDPSPVFKVIDDQTPELISIPIEVFGSCSIGNFAPSDCDALPPGWKPSGGSFFDISITSPGLPHSAGAVKMSKSKILSIFARDEDQIALDGTGSVLPATPPYGVRVSGGGLVVRAARAQPFPVRQAEPAD